MFGSLTLSKIFSRCTNRNPSPRHGHTRANAMLDRNNLASILMKYDTIMLDCDGVLWNTDHITPIPGIKDAIAALRKLGKRVLFVTNNSMHGRQAYLKKFQELAGFEAEKDDVFGVAYAAAVYLKDVAPIKGRCYLIGEEGLAEELDEAGIPHVGLGPDPDPPTGNPKKLLEIDLADDIGAVVVGFDKNFSYNKLFRAASYLSSPNCRYIATNDVEMGVMIAPGRRQPITGSLTVAVTAASKRRPTVLGKPHRTLMDCISAKIPHLNKSRTLFVGDSLQTDILFANRNNIDSVLVLTGVSQLPDIDHHKDNYPTYILPSLANIGQWC